MKSHELQWRVLVGKSQEAQRVLSSRSKQLAALVDLTQAFDKETKTSFLPDSCFYYQNYLDQSECEVCSYSPKRTKCRESAGKLPSTNYLLLP